MDCEVDLSDLSNLALNYGSHAAVVGSGGDFVADIEVDLNALGT